MTKICSDKEGIVFAFHEDGRDLIDENTEEKQQVSAHELYAEEKLRKPEYQRIRISLGRLNRILVLVENSWLHASRQHARKELENLLDRQHELEKETEGIEDIFLREYIYEQIDMIAAARRSLVEDVRWDIESNKIRPGII